MSNKLAPATLDLTLRDLRKCNRPFGGATVLLSGDWRQVGPVVPLGTAHDVVDAAFISSFTCGSMSNDSASRHLCAIALMNLTPNPYAPLVKVEFHPPHSDKSEVITLQHSSTTADSDSQQSTCTVQGDTDLQHLIDFVYPDLLTADPTLLAARGILAPRNVSIDDINNHILHLLPNTSRSLLISNSLIKSNPRDIEEVTSTAFLEAVDVPGVHPHNLHLKVGCVLMFIHNVNFDSGIVNGKKGIVRAGSPRIVDVEVIAPGAPLVKIPRILFEVKVGSKGITFHRKHFPLRGCYAVTSTKAKVRL